MHLYYDNTYHLNMVAIYSNTKYLSDRGIKDSLDRGDLVMDVIYICDNNPQEVPEEYKDNIWTIEAYKYY